VQRTTHAAVLSAAAIAAALGLGGCGDDDKQADRPPETPAPLTSPSTSATEAAAPLPPVSALTDVVARFTDPAVPGAQKIGLVQYGTADDGAALDRLTKALSDNGYMPLTVDARDLVWAPSHPGDVVATVTIKTANAPSGSDFTFPMEFSPIRDSWQLTRETADMLLKFGEQSTAQPTR
jgi:hypothetical protein